MSLLLAKYVHITLARLTSVAYAVCQIKRSINMPIYDGVSVIKYPPFVETKWNLQPTPGISRETAFNSAVNGDNKPPEIKPIEIKDTRQTFILTVISADKLWIAKTVTNAGSDSGKPNVTHHGIAKKRQSTVDHSLP